MQLLASVPTALKNVLQLRMSVACAARVIAAVPFGPASVAVFESNSDRILELEVDDDLACESDGAVWPLMLQVSSEVSVASRWRKQIAAVVPETLTVFHGGTSSARLRFNVLVKQVATHRTVDRLTDYALARGSLLTCTSTLGAAVDRCSSTDGYAPTATSTSATRIIPTSAGPLLLDDGSGAWLPGQTERVDLTDIAGARITSGAELPGAGVVIAANVAEVSGSILVRGPADGSVDAFRWWALLPGVTDITGLVEWEDGVLFGSAQGVGFFSPVSGAAMVETPLVRVRSLIKVETGFVFVLGETAEGAPGFIWIAP